MKRRAIATPPFDAGANTPTRATRRPAASAGGEDSERDHAVGYGRPPVQTRFQKGRSGNPSGKRRGPRVPKNLGNQMDAIAVAFMTELNTLMTSDPSKLSPPKGPFAGIRLYARVCFKEAMTKDGTCRKLLSDIYFVSRRNIEPLQPKDRQEEEADIMREIIRAMLDPSVDEAGMAKLFCRLRDEE